MTKGPWGHSTDTWLKIKTCTILKILAVPKSVVVFCNNAILILILRFSIQSIVMIIIISIIIINVYLFYFEYLKKFGQTSVISLHTDWQMV